MLNIKEISKKLNLNEEDIELYGNYKAKINYDYNNKKIGKLILVTSTSPTPFGEGKTTTSIGLNDSLNKLNKKSVVVLREPSMGPVFGKKGGAVGGGKALVIPEDDINLNFTGDFHAITYSNNLISAIIDNHIYQGNELNIDKVVFNRCLDVNDRSLRHVVVNGKETNFVITPASEIMSIIGLSENMNDLKENIGNITVGYDKNNKSVYLKELKCVNAVCKVLKETLKPNLVQTLYGNPAIIHGGPFANISYGCNSITASKTAMALSDYTITEAGFGSDMGALKFFDIKTRKFNIYPDVIVINTTIRGLKYNGENSLEKGIVNLKYHIDNMKKFSSNVIVSLNKFNSDQDEEIEFIKKYCERENVEFSVTTSFNDGEDGAIELANKIINMKDNSVKYQIYNNDDKLIDKINKMCKMFNARNVIINEEINNKIINLEKEYPSYPICICKTPYSISDTDKLLGYPKDFDMTIKDIKVYSGAGFIVVYMGNVLTMPGLSKDSNYLKEEING